MRAIGGAVGVNERTVRRDLAPAASAAPKRVTGLDGKSYPATRRAQGDNGDSDDSVLPDHSKSSVAAEPANGKRQTIRANAAKRRVETIVGTCRALSVSSPSAWREQSRLPLRDSHHTQGNPSLCVNRALARLTNLGRRSTVPATNRAGDASTSRPSATKGESSMRTHPSREVDVERFVRRSAVAMVLTSLADPPARSGLKPLVSIPSGGLLGELDEIVGDLADSLDAELWPTDYSLFTGERDRAMDRAHGLAGEILTTLAGNAKALRTLAKSLGHSTTLAEAA